MFWFELCDIHRCTRSHCKNAPLEELQHFLNWTCIFYGYTELEFVRKRFFHCWWIHSHQEKIYVFWCLVLCIQVYVWQQEFCLMHSPKYVLYCFGDWWCVGSQLVYFNTQRQPSRKCIKKHLESYASPHQLEQLILSCAKCSTSKYYFPVHVCRYLKQELICCDWKI